MSRKTGEANPQNRKLQGQTLNVLGVWSPVVSRNRRGRGGKPPENEEDDDQNVQLRGLGFR